MPTPAPVSSWLQKKPAGNPSGPQGDRIVGFEPMAKLKPDLHDIYNRGTDIDRALERVIFDAVDKRIKEVEIIP